jgi:integrase/recombinase XerD
MDEHLAIFLKAPESYPVAYCNNDEDLIELWLFEKPRTTQDAYRRDIGQFKQWSLKAIADVRLNDLIGYYRYLQVRHLEPGRERKPLKTSSIHRKINTLRSLLAYAVRIQYIPQDPSEALELPDIKNELASRILPESAMHRLIEAANPGRDRLLLRFLYKSGCRVSEVVSLTWGDVQDRGAFGQVTIFGKGGKTRHLCIYPPFWNDLLAYRGDARKNAPIFRSRSGQALCRQDLNRIIRDVAKRAGIEGNVSPHWFRHAHASHSLDRGAPLTLVQSTLGHSSIKTTENYLHVRPNDSSSRFIGD